MKEKIKNPGIKISVIISIIIIVATIAISVIISTTTLNLTLNLTEDAAKVANQTLITAIDRGKVEVQLYAKMLSESYEIINDIVKEDYTTLKEYLHMLELNVDMITICDPNGVVLARLHSEQVGDIIDIAEAIDTSNENKGIVTRSMAGKLITSGSSIIYDSDKNIVGVILCGYDLSNPIYVDRIKEYGYEAGIFDYDTRINTTITIDGVRVTGTKAPTEAIDIVLEQGKEFISNISLFENEYAVCYSPLMVDDEIIGMLFTGVNIDNLLEQEQVTTDWLITIIIFIGILCIILAAIFNSLLIYQPLKEFNSMMHKVVLNDDSKK